ncbi:alkaline phosphatase family protein [Halodesulfurarchaeum sp. HSR-GB]|uniref:alkaline phosphatase family protein n=1 Tax=Halodesulfurarchaeum sp. HSR-GB TaxID=3074077 RepID=UPI00285F3101|nr:alkaline phosphatase family protein [Halodesulfurarchaeum sp. HSR-GB]MDR5657005.1 alkaline phosphatase family protein [Halodesulfurarchaeum sp. HSR-GB]
MTRTFVVGLDGASWRLLEPWIEAGELPNLERLRETGTWAGTRSELPPVTFPNWKCYSSGKNPGGFGVYWFEHVDLEAGTIDVADGSDFQTVELWDYLNDAGQSTGVVNMPTMYPPREIDGPIVCGGPDAAEGEYRAIDSGYTSPPELAAELEERFDYRVHPDPLLSGNDERGAEVEAILELLDTHFEAALSLFEEQDLDFVHVTLFYLNVLHHFFWDEEPTRRAWTLVDEWLGRIGELEDTNVVLMSDHGSAPTTTEFYINEWLAENGYQTHSRTVDDTLQQLGLNRETVLGIAKRLGLVDTLAAIVPERLQQLVPQADGLKRQRKLEAIDLEHTQAVASGQGPVYLNPAFDVDSVREQLMADLREVEDEQGPIFSAVHPGEEVYSGPFRDSAPEIVVDQRPGVHVNDGIGGGTIMSGPDRWAAENTPFGIFVANGPSFESHGELDRISILDIAPTVLAAQGADVPTDMNGSVLPILAGDSDWDFREPLAFDERAGSEDTATVEKRLQQLGYME